MDEESTLAPKDYVTRRSAFKLREKGALYLEFNEARVFAYRPSPPRVWTRRKTDDGSKWLALRDPPLAIGDLIREIRVEDALMAGTLKWNDVPVEARPKRGSFYVRRRVNLRLFLHEVPRAVQDETSRGFQEGTWPLFRFLQSTPAALELCQSEDGARLAWLLANAHVLLLDEALIEPWSEQKRRPDTLAFARRWMTKKRKVILGRLGFAATSASVAALAKVPRHHLSATTARLLRTVLLHPESKAIAAHLPRLSTALLHFLNAPEFISRVHHDLFVELSGGNLVSFGASATVDELRDTVALAAQLDATLPLFKSRDQIRAMHDVLTEKARLLTQASNQLLPPFPLSLSPPEAAVMAHLGTTLTLMGEGQGMHHCLGTLQMHHTLAAQGRFHAFAVKEPIRATLAFIRPTGGPWGIYDFKAFANAPVPVDMHHLAASLLRRLNVGSRAVQGTLF